MRCSAISLSGSKARAHVSLFVYDNDTFIVESFLPDQAQLTVVVDPRYSSAEDVLSGESLAVQKVRRRPGFGPRAQGDRVTIGLTVKPHSYRVLRLKKAQ